jgi:HAD superfamily hydrolase (TIGR01509 family)
MIKAITFDCWNTLIVDDEGRRGKMKAYFQVIFQENRVSLNDEEIDTIFADELVLFENYVLSHHKTLNARGRAETLLRLAGIELPEERLLRVAHDCDHMALEARPPLVSGVKETLKTLAATQKLALICNTGFHGAATLKVILEDHGILPYFDQLVFSDKAGMAKPNIRIFHAALQELGCNPEEAVHVGDSEPADIRGAKHAGMRAVLFTGVSDRYAEDNTADAVVSSYDDFPRIMSMLSR